MSDGGDGRRILVVRLGSMGDIIHILPAVAALRRTFPAATIGWAIEQRWLALVSTPGAVSGPRGPQKPLIDVVHATDTLAWRAAPSSDKTWREMLSVARSLRAERYDAAVDFQGALKSALVAQISGAPRRIGFAQPREKPATLLYSCPVVARGRHIIEQNFSLSYAAGATPDSVESLLPCDPEAERACERELRTRDLRDFAIVNPGAGWGAKCWPAERYGQVARELAADGLRSVVNFGPGEEELARMVESASAGTATAIPCSPGELIALTRRACLFLGGDTGPMHLAAAAGVPVVAIFGPTDPERNGPYASNSIVLRSGTSQTRTSHVAEPDEGLLRISVHEVVAAARSLLEVRQ